MSEQAQALVSAVHELVRALQRIANNDEDLDTEGLSNIADQALEDYDKATRSI